MYRMFKGISQDIKSINNKKFQNAKKGINKTKPGGY